MSYGSSTPINFDELAGSGGDYPYPGIFAATFTGAKNNWNDEKLPHLEFTMKLDKDLTTGEAINLEYSLKELKVREEGDIAKKMYNSVARLAAIFFAFGVPKEQIQSVASQEYASYEAFAAAWFSLLRTNEHVKGSKVELKLVASWNEAKQRFYANHPFYLGFIIPYKEGETQLKFSANERKAINEYNSFTPKEKSADVPATHPDAAVAAFDGADDF